MTGNRVVVDEPELVTRAIDGDVEAFRSLIERHDEGLRGFAFRLLGDRDAVDDALQESYLKAFRALPRLGEGLAFKSWLYRILYNTCLDEVRRRRRVEVVPIETVDRHGDPRRDPGDIAADKLDLVEAIESLTPETRAAVLWFTCSSPRADARSIASRQGRARSDPGSLVRIPGGDLARGGR